MIRLIIYTLVLCIISSLGFAQTRKTNDSKANPKSPASASFKLKTSLGKNSGNAEVSADEARQLINFPIRVVDDKNHNCLIISYGFMYKRKGSFEDENTGKTVSTFTNVGDHFTTTPFPAIWKDNLTESLQKDEELYFYDIIIKDPSGRKTIAPELKIKLL